MSADDGDVEPPSPPPPNDDGLGSLPEDVPPPPPPMDTYAGSAANAAMAIANGAIKSANNSRSAPASPMTKTKPSTPSALSLAVAANKSAAPTAASPRSQTASPQPTASGSGSGGSAVPPPPPPTQVMSGDVVLNVNPMMKGRLLVDGQPVPTPLAIDPKKPISETIELLMERIVHMDRIVTRASQEKSAFLNKIGRLQREKQYVSGLGATSSHPN